MEKIINILDVLALLVQLIGSGFIYYNSPENIPVGSPIGFGETDFKTPKKRNKALKTGFLILSIGFVIAIVSLVLKDFFIPTHN